MRPTTLFLPALALATATLLVPLSAQESGSAGGPSLSAEVAAAATTSQIPVLPPAAGRRDAPPRRARLEISPPAPVAAREPATSDLAWLDAEAHLGPGPRYGAGGLGGPDAPVGGATDRGAAPEPQTWGLLLMCLCALGVTIARYGLHDRAPRVRRRA